MASRARRRCARSAISSGVMPATVPAPLPERLDRRGPAAEPPGPAELRGFGQPPAGLVVERTEPAAPLLRERDQRGRTVVVPSEGGGRSKRHAQLLLGEVAVAEQ